MVAPRSADIERRLIAILQKWITPLGHPLCDSAI